MRRRNHGRYRHSWGKQHDAQRCRLSLTLGGIDKHIEHIFLNLPAPKRESVFLRYGEEYGKSALSYARKTYTKWKYGTVRMGGAVAERLINLVPPVLEPETRFELVSKLRIAHLHKERRYVSCLPSHWRSQVTPVVADLLAKSQEFELPPHVLDRIRWLTEADAVTAQQLLATAEQEEAVVRLRYLEAEFDRIDSLLQNIQATRSVQHTIELPQGTVVIVIELPQKSWWQRLVEFLS